MFAPAARTEFYTSDLNSWYTFGVHEPNLMLYVAVCMYVRKRTRQLFLTPSNWFGIEPPFHSCSKICKNDAILFFFHQFKIKAFSGWGGSWTLYILVMRVNFCINWAILVIDNDKDFISVRLYSMMLIYPLRQTIWIPKITPFFGFRATVLCW